MDIQTSTRNTEPLRAAFGDRLQENYAIGKYTSARVGGPADLFLSVQSAAELQAAVELAYANEIPYFILGGGSNILVSDNGLSGLVILNRARNVRFRHSGVGVVCEVESGMNLSALTRLCISRGLEGLEWAIGIPGTVGGAVVGNAGAHGGDMAGNLLSTMVWEPGAGARMFTKRELEYAYRNSMLKREQQASGARRVVLSAELELKPEAVEILTARAEGFNAYRKQTQPAGASMGSMFKNPEHYYAGYLLDAAGLKGFAVGEAQISEKHANFFMNKGGASAEEIRQLLAEAWHAVREQFGIELEAEVELVGNWDFDEA